MVGVETINQQQPNLAARAPSQRSRRGEGGGGAWGMRTGPMERVIGVERRGEVRRGGGRFPAGSICTGEVGWGGSLRVVARMQWGGTGLPLWNPETDKLW